MDTIIIDPRFNRFPDIALGGYVGGVLAHTRAKAEIQLRRPVRLGRPYQKMVLPDGTEALQEGSDVFAVARDASVDLEPPRPVGLEASEIASLDYVGHHRHFVTNCFVCGPSRSEGDGLRIFPGIITGREDIVAAPWMPSMSLANSSGIVGSEYTWSALDCPSIWALILLGRADSDERAVTSRLAVELISPIIAGQPQVVMGWKVSETGRMRVAGGAIFSPEGKLRAIAKHTLVTTDWGVPLGLDRWR
jgi:hypothetical protein